MKSGTDLDSFAIYSMYNVLVLVPVYGTSTQINNIPLYSTRDIALKI
jgi:hypothetical protein